MPKKSERFTTLPAGLLPLLSQPQLETYYGVSDWTVLQWIEKGLPSRPFPGRQKRFDLVEVEAWMAEQDPEFVDAGATAPLLVAASA